MGLRLPAKPPVVWSGKSCGILFVNNDDPMNMVRHDNKFVQFHKWKLDWDLVPDRLCVNCGGCGIQFPGFDGAKKWVLVFGADGNKIGSGDTVIVSV